MSNFHPSSRAVRLMPPTTLSHSSTIETTAPIARGAGARAVVRRWVSRSPRWPDEALRVNIAKRPLGEIGAALRDDAHPPLYYGLLHGCMSVFGPSGVALRALSGILALVT